MNIYKNQKREIYQKIEVISNQVTKLEVERAGFSKRVHPVYNTPFLLKKGVNELEHRLETTSMDKNAEKKIVLEIDKIK